MQDLKEIQKLFNKVVSFSQEIPEPETNQLFKDWKRNKADFINMMNGQLIYEYPQKISFEMDEKTKQSKIDDFIYRVDDYYNNHELAEFIAAQQDGFFGNQVVFSYTTPSGVMIPKGMKLVKAFKFFEKSEKWLRDIQSKASMIIQENKVEGTLCLSVHPLDYLSSSENQHNWRTCHSLDGEYRAGNLSYMVDNSTVVCYLKTKSETTLPNFPEDVKWNSKKWRVLLFFSNNKKMMFAGRQYPFSTETGLDFIRDKVLPNIGFGHWSNWSSKKISSFSDSDKDINFMMNSPYVPLGNELISLDKLIVNEPNSLMFNDLLYSSCYEPSYAYQLEEELVYHWWDDGEPAKTTYHLPRIGIERTRFHIGGETQCCRCGKKHIELSETFMCNDCELSYGTSESDIFAFCPCCGQRYIYDEGWWVNLAEETVCPECAEDEVAVCDNCRDSFYISDGHFDSEKGVYYCKYCKEDLDIEIHCEEEE